MLLTGANRGLGCVPAEPLLDARVAKLYAAARRPDTLTTTLLINNAGVAAFAPGLTAPPDDVAREMATNFGGTYAMVRAFAPVIEGNGGGAIVNVLSMAGLAAIPPLAHPSIPHSSPEEVAAGIFARVEAGDEDIFPCSLSRAESEVWWADPKGLERRHTGH